MKQTITKSDFRDAFQHMDRKDNFSYEALGALYDFLEDITPEYELDVIALCCEFEEQDIKYVLENYNLESLDDLSEETMIIWHDETTVLYQVY